METTAEEVWIKATNSRRVEYYHTDEDCFYLQNANSYMKKAPSVLHDDLDECSRCADSYRPSRDSSTHYQDILEANDDIEDIPSPEAG